MERTIRLSPSPECPVSPPLPAEAAGVEHAVGRSLRPRLPPPRPRAGFANEHRASHGAPVGEGPSRPPQSPPPLHRRGDAKVQRATQAEGESHF